MPTEQPARLTVWADGSVMGCLWRERGTLAFEYAKSWQEDPAAFPLSLSLPLDVPAHGGPKVENVLDNLLPDEVEIRRAIARNVGASGADAYSLLAAIGRDCVGALQFLPEDEVGWQGGYPLGRPLAEEQVAELLETLHTTPLGVTLDRGFRISLAGAQAKTTLLWWEGTWWLPEGATPSTHILKPAIGVRGGVDLSDSVYNEFVCLAICRELGLEVAEATVELFAGVPALVVKRFDREASDSTSLRRLPFEDICQALGLPSSKKYEADGGPGIKEVLHLLQSSDKPLVDRESFFRAAFAFWLIGAGDGHAKNFSLALGPYPGFRLAPLYDVMSIEPYFKRGEVRRQDYRLAMAVGKNRHYRVHEIVPRHFADTARAARVDEDSAWEWMQDIARRVPTAVDRVWSQVRGTKSEPVLDLVARGIEERLKAIEAA